MVMILASSVCHQSDGIGRSVKKQVVDVNNLTGRRKAELYYYYCCCYYYHTVNINCSNFIAKYV